MFDYLKLDTDTHTLRGVKTKLQGAELHVQWCRKLVNMNIGDKHL